MKFSQIDEITGVFPGEYILHVPTQQVVLCGAFMRTEGVIKSLANGSLLTDKIENFRKIDLTPEEQKKKTFGGCKGCGAGRQ